MSHTLRENLGAVSSIGNLKIKFHSLEEQFVVLEADLEYSSALFLAFFTKRTNFEVEQALGEEHEN